MAALSSTSSGVTRMTPLARKAGGDHDLRQRDRQGPRVVSVADVDAHAAAQFETGEIRRPREHRLLHHAALGVGRDIVALGLLAGEADPERLERRLADGVTDMDADLHGL